MARDPIVQDPNLDPSTYPGRVRRCLQITDPSTLLVSDEGLAQAQETIKKREAGDTSISNETYWGAIKVRDSVIHPDTGEKIPMLFRMSAFVPANLVIVAGMLHPGTIASNHWTIFWQVVNQVYMVGVNYANRNATSSMSDAEVGVAFGASVGSSVGVAYSMNRWLQGAAHLTPGARALLQNLVPFTAVAAAHFLTVGLMRQAELKQGVTVTDKEGREIGKSVRAGYYAVGQTIACRMLTSTCILVAPPIFMNRIEGYFPNTRGGRAAKMATQLAVVGGALYAGTPLGIGAFPQIAPISVKSLEPEFHSLKDKNGMAIDTLYFNKGL
eukprot:TRINITY_DN19868_c0_g1::TRINITY_DN19868_c0_g1_i1::g.28949::m.28949 TRINITY_DN19868_c0_g1::TRINITY_DN19868_c0_g1_i1::g.28949  ORF type:complete len:341 (-),score=99.31,sp/Q12029/FSF1_YEAST/37.93/5e-71,Mtc/PF03820.12/1.4e-84 TRINITY_DN19868_c0_g1_i1:592-1572(-)